jgi:hypothetical protein
MALVLEISKAAIKADARIIGQSSFVVVLTKARAVIGPSA